MVLTRRLPSARRATGCAPAAGAAAGGAAGAAGGVVGAADGGGGACACNAGGGGGRVAVDIDGCADAGARYASAEATGSVGATLAGDATREATGEAAYVGDAYAELGAGAGVRSGMGAVGAAEPVGDMACAMLSR